MANKLGMLLLMVGAMLAQVAFAADETLAPIPSLTARVTDTTGTLTAQQVSTLTATLAALEQRKGAQIAVLMVPTTAPEAIEQYATRVFEQWKLGRKGVDDGVLVIIAKNDRRERIEVAYGLEGAIPDAAAKRIAHDYMSPKFRDGDFGGGIASGVDMLTRLIDEEPLPSVQPRAQAQRPQGIPLPEPWWSPVQLIVGIFFGAFLGVILVLIVMRQRVYPFVLGRLPERARVYAFGLIDALPIALLLRHPMAALGAFAAGGTLASMLGLSKPPRRGGSGRGGGGGWSSSGGGSSDSGSSGSDSSSGDFSGGGGSSGGGGASDSW